MRGVTQDNLRNALYTGISTRTPHAGSDFVPVGIEITNEISTRTPHAGSDRARISAPHTMRFQPALPMRGVTDLEAPMNGDI